MGIASRFLTWIHFLGKRLFLILSIGMVTGLFSMVVEVGFAYSLQATFLHLGVLQGTPLSVPAWFPVHSFPQALALMAIIGLGRALTQFLLVYLHGVAYESFKASQRSRLVRWAYREDSVGIGSFMSLFNDSVFAGANAMSYIQISLINGFMAAALAVVLLVMTPKATIFMIAIAGVVAIMTRGLDVQVGKASHQISVATDSFNRRIQMNLKNLLLLRVYGVSEREETATRSSIDDYHRNAMRFYALSALKFGSVQVFAVGALCALIVFEKQYSGFNKAAFVPYLYLFLRFVQALAETSRNIANAQGARAQLGSLMGWWLRVKDKILSYDLLKGVPDQSPVRAPVGWVANSIGFSYAQENRKIFEGLSFAVRPRSCTVLIGPSGAGKTSLLYLLLGVISPTEGELSIVTESGERLSFESCRQSFLDGIGYVGPESLLISGTIRENLLYGLRELPSDAEIQRCLQTAECQFVDELQGGLSHLVTDQGQGLSAGQKQRLSLARALLRRPCVLVLDEPTANLDRQTEEKLLEAFRKLKGTMTIVLVTHRSSLVSLGDQVLRLGDNEEARETQDPY